MHKHITLISPRTRIRRVHVRNRLFIRQQLKKQEKTSDKKTVPLYYTRSATQCTFIHSRLTSHSMTYNIKNGILKNNLFTICNICCITIPFQVYIYFKYFLTYYQHLVISPQVAGRLYFE